MRAFLEGVRESLAPRHSRLLVAAYRDGVAEAASFGVPEDSDMEIGSVSKGLTGLLLHEALSRGEVTRDTTLGASLGLTGPLAEVTLGAISTHTSGLPGLPTMHERPLLQRYWRMWRTGENPYGDTVAELLAQAEETELKRAKFRYSNFGFQLLGAALGRAAGVSYAELLESRIAGPLGMTGTYCPSVPGELRPSALTGVSGRGRSQDAWTGEALGPAGGVRCTAADLGVLLGALAEGIAPGIGALDVVHPMGPRMGIGAAWMTIDEPKRGWHATWHNGRTGGFGSWLGVDRERRLGLAVVTAKASSVDREGFDALARLAAG